MPVINRTFYLVTYNDPSVGLESTHGTVSMKFDLDVPDADIAAFDSAAKAALKNLNLFNQTPIYVYTKEEIEAMTSLEGETELEDTIDHRVHTALGEMKDRIGKNFNNPKGMNKLISKYLDGKLKSATYDKILKKYNLTAKQIKDILR